MHFSQRTFKLFVLLLLSSSDVLKAFAAPEPYALQARAGNGKSPVRDTPLPEHKEDKLPDGDARQMRAWSDDDYENEDYKNAPDYDPSEDKDFDTGNTKKRSIGHLLDKRAPTPGTTEWLRHQGYDGKSYRQAFEDSDEKNWIGIKETKGDKNTQISMIEDTKAFEVPKPKPRNYKSWQADHVLDLGFFTTIAQTDKPDDLEDGTWETIQDAILGEDIACLFLMMTQALAQELNNPNNIRGITFKMNQFKNQIMAFAYGREKQKKDYKSWLRSTTWAVYRYMKQTKAQFDEVKDKAGNSIQNMIMDEDQGQKVAKHFKEEIDRMYDRAIEELERVLKDPPADNDKDSIFKSEDCKNTKDSPDTAPASTQPIDPPSQPSCFPNPTDHVRDAHEANVDRCASFFCSKYGKDTLPGPKIDVEHAVAPKLISAGRGSILVGADYGGDDPHMDDIYDISIKSIDNCTPVGDGKFNLGEPVGGHQCKDILHDAWKNCE
ncbi:MAG: hypothetical protein Q9167_006048 [Letrouitia subvulpina]